MKFGEEQIAILKGCSDVQEAVAKLAEQGVVVSADELEKLKELNEFAALDEAELGSVCGGCGTPSDGAAPSYGEYSSSKSCPLCHDLGNSALKDQDNYYNYYHCNGCNVDWYCDADKANW